MTSLAGLPDPLLIEAYERAIEIELDPHFIKLLFTELNRRGIIIVKINRKLFEYS